jgi:hypothetical protein
MRLRHSAPEKIADDAEIILSAEISYGKKRAQGREITLFPALFVLIKVNVLHFRFSIFLPKQWPVKMFYPTDNGE